MQWSDQWSRFSQAEFLLLGLLVALLVVFSEERPRIRRRWDRPVSVDDSFRKRLRRSTSRGRRRATRASDALLWVFTAAPFVLALWLSRASSSDLGIQIALISTLSVLLTSVANRVATTFTGRPRPYTRVTNAQGELKRHPQGHPERLRSFFSGHTGVTATGASLLALFAWQLASPPIVAATALLSAAAISTVAWLRVAADRHYASDVIVGAVVGISAGGVLPYLLHFS